MKNLLVITAKFQKFFLTGLVYFGGTFFLQDAMASPDNQLQNGKVVAKSDWRQIKTPPLRSVKLQEPKRIQLSNGMILFLQPDHEIPLIEATILVQGGSDEEPASKVGLVQLYGRTWVTGGTKTQTGDQLDDFFGNRGIHMNSSGASKFTLLSFSCLKTDFDVTAQRAFSLLRQPEFREEKLSLEKNKLLTGLQAQNDSPGYIAFREAAKVAFGSEHPHARQPNPATIHAIQRADLLLWHKQHVFPNRMMVGISGDFDPEEMEKKLRKEFETWQKGPEYIAPKIAFSETHPGVHFVQKEDVTQSSIWFVQLGQTRKNPDFYAIQVLNQILSGNSLTGRLFESIRTKQGLAYSVGGSIGSGWKEPDLYAVSLATDSKNTVKAIKAVYEEMERLSKNPPSLEEVQAAKDQILNSFVFTFEDKANLLLDRLNLELFGYPLDWTQKYPDEIKKVTVSDVNRVIQKYVNSKGFAVVVVGKEKDFDQPLSSLGMGPVHQIELPTQSNMKPMLKKSAK